MSYRAVQGLPFQWNLAAVTLALGYPWFLAGFYLAVSNHHLASAILTIALVFAVPACAFLSLRRLSGLDGGDRRVVILRRLSHFAFASPSLFVILGVLLYLMKINDQDPKVWLGLWSVVIVWSILDLSAVRINTPLVVSLPNTTRVRVLHGAASVAIIAAFLFPHLGNHALGIFGNDLHRSTMHALRQVYRAGWLEPILISLFFFQIVSGLVLLSPKLYEKQDVLGSLQTASGAYLVVFIASHINSVFVLARYFGTDTDYVWATGGSAGLLGDAWEVRLIPHYALGVLFVLCHIVCGLRTVMLAHGIDIRQANRVAWSLIAACSIWDLVVVAGMLGVRV